MTKTAPFLFVFFLLLGCGSGGAGTDVTFSRSQGGRILGMDVKEIPSVTYAMAYSQAVSLGVREVSVSLDWSSLEPTAGNYDNSLLAIMDAFYPLQVGDLALVLRPLDTSGPSIPAGLVGLAYDDQRVIDAFGMFLVNLHSNLSTLNASGKLKWIHIGNEIDAYLGKDAARWAQWKTFFQAAKAKVRSLWGASVQVSSIVQFSVLNDSEKYALYLSLLPALDNAVFTYYPLNADFTVRPISTVASDFATMVNKIPGKTILLQECGYPSGFLNSSSEAQQADFITAVFDTWDNHIDRIRLIDLAWQYDVSATTVDQWVMDYGMSGSPNEGAFRAYLGTLGLGRYDGTEKPAMQRLRDELRARNWEQ